MTLPTYLGPVARAYYFWTAHLTPAQRAERKQLFGSFRDGLRPVKPYRWSLSGGRTLLEIPVTTMPVLKAPFHLSYLLYMARVSERLMMSYLRTALAVCRASGVEPSFLLHPLDLHERCAFDLRAHLGDYGFCKGARLVHTLPLPTRQ